jgi:patatin-like phospholipase/acyl hydrolase
VTEKAQNESGRFQILSLDGGGLKGLFGISFLAAWEECEKRSVTEYFDLIAGTSTGGIIALALGAGYSAKEILQFYVKEAANIFPPSALAGIRHWVSTKYRADGLEIALREYFGEKKLGDSRKPLIVPAYYPKAGGLYIFKTPHHPRLRNDYREMIRDVARATSAAPTYLPAYKGDSGVELVDGGVWANNPVMLAVTEAMGYLEVPQMQVCALRIGTTTTVPSVQSISDEGGKLGMAKAVLDYMMRGQEQSASTMALHLLGPQRYHEVNITAAAGDFELDRLSEDLIGLGQNQWRFHSSNLAEKSFLNHKPKEYAPCYVS